MQEFIQTYENYVLVPLTLLGLFFLAWLAYIGYED